MLYEDYLVTDCGIMPADEKSNQEVYFCKMVGRDNHKIGFSLIIKGCVGEAEYRTKYDAVAPNIKVGDLLHCEFAFQWHHSELQLCISGILKSKAVKLVSGIPIAEISGADYLNPNRGYWTVAMSVGDWMRFPGLISCDGEAFVHTDFDRTYPQFRDYLDYGKSGALVWQKRSASCSLLEKMKIKLANLIA